MIQFVWFFTHVKIDANCLQFVNWSPLSLFTCPTTLYATPGKSFSSKSSKQTPVSKQRLKLSNEWNDNDATCGRPHRSEPSSTSSSYLIQRAVSFHSRSSPTPINSSSCTNTSCGLWSKFFLGDIVVMSRREIFSLTCGNTLWRRIPRGSSDRCDVNSLMSASYVQSNLIWFLKNSQRQKKNMKILTSSPASSGWTDMRRPVALKPIAPPPILKPAPPDVPNELDSFWRRHVWWLSCIDDFLRL